VRPGIIFFGINHFNPLHRWHLGTRLQQRAGEFGAPPSAVAVEWDSTKALHVITRQRGPFRTTCANDWSLTDPKVLDVLEMSLGYEADTHIDLFPKTLTIWLDDGDDRSIENYAVGRMKLYRWFLGIKEGESPPQDVVGAIAAACRALDAQPPEPRRHRDIKFTVALDHVASRLPNDAWVAVIVGGSHAINEEGSMHRQVADLGYPCTEFSLLRS